MSTAQRLWDLSDAEMDQVHEEGMSSPDVVDVNGTDRKIRATASDEVSTVEGRWRDGESVRDIKWDYV